MNPRRFLPVVATLFLVASPLPVPAGVEVDVLSIDPRNPKIVLLQIHLNLALQRYEKGLADLKEMKTTLAMRPDNTGLTAEQIKIRDERAQSQHDMLDYTCLELRAQITEMLEEAQKHAEELEKKKLQAREKEASQPKGVSGTAQDPALQGKWREASGKCTLEVKGDTLHLQGEGLKDNWFKATFILPVAAAQPVGQPRQIRATITQCSVPDMVGQTSMAIYTLEKGTLTLVANKPGFPHPPKTFEGDPESRRFSFKQLVEH